MRWKAGPVKPIRKVGDTRFKTGFLFFPKCLNGEWRWLESTIWIQEMYLGTAGGPEGPSYGVLRWQSTDWADHRAGSIKHAQRLVPPQGGSGVKG
jgi:hypothetical protein